MLHRMTVLSMPEELKIPTQQLLINKRYYTVKRYTIELDFYVHDIGVRRIVALELLYSELIVDSHSIHPNDYTIGYV